jgi:MFS family permease
VNAVLAPSLVGALALTPGQLGLLTSAFFFAFALVQLPVGIALDRYGPRRVQPILMLVASLGALLFAQGTTFIELLAARAIIGFGLGGCFMSAVKSVSTWISPARLPSVHGYLIAVGGLGAASATLPVRMIACVGGLIWLVTPRTHQGAGRVPTVRSLCDVYRHPAFRKTIALVLLPHAVFFGVQGLWIGRWLADVAHYNDAIVAYLLYLGMAAVIFGAIAVGMVTEWAGRRGIVPLDVAAAGVALFVLVQFAIVLNHAPSLRLLSVLFTLMGTITGIEYAIVAQTMPRELTGRAATCLNLLIFVGAFLVQAGFGWVVGWWQPDSAQRFPAQAYQVAFGALALLQLPGVVLYYLRRRPVECPLKHCEDEYEAGSLR